LVIDCTVASGIFNGYSYPYSSFKKIKVNRVNFSQILQKAIKEYLGIEREVTKQ